MTNLRADTLRDSFRFAERITRQSGSSFRLSFFLLPRPAFRAMCVLYAFMRLTDDLADAPLQAPNLTDSAASPQIIRAEQLRCWREGLRLCLGEALDQHPLHPALRFVVSEYQIDPEWLEDVITGVEYDLVPGTIRDYTELNRYCYLVAGTVGLCCQAIWGANIEQTRPQALACGEAFQLTNILRDLSEDAQQGRCYLPLSELQQFGYSPEMLQNKICTAQFLPLMTMQLERAQQFYAESAGLEESLQGPGRRMFRVMYATYYRLLQKIAQNPTLCLERRIRLSRRQRFTLLLTAPHRSVKKHQLIFQ